MPNMNMVPNMNMPRTQTPYNMPMQPGYKIGANVRNQGNYEQVHGGIQGMGQPNPMAQTMPNPIHGIEQSPAGGDNTSEPLNAARLARVPQNEQKQLIGEQLYPQVKDLCNEDDAGKVTGMILELENEELLQLIENPDMIRIKVNEARAVLESHNPAQEAEVAN